MKNYIILAMLGMATLIGCSEDSDIVSLAEAIEANTLSIQMTAIGFTDGNTAGKSNRATNVSWNHIFGGTGTLTFTNTSTSNGNDSIYTVDMTDFAANGLTKTLINGTYDVTLTMDESTPVTYVPVSATNNFNLSGDTNLALTATTTYGMILLDPYLIDASVSPIFATGGTDYTLIQDQGYYYLYAPDGVTGTLTVKESLFGQTVSKEVTIATSTIDALALAPVTSNAVVSLTLEAFTIESEDWDIDVPTSGITTSLGIFTDSGQSLSSSNSHDIFLGDLDGDADLDAFVVNINQPNKVWINDGNGIFTDSGQILGSSKSFGVYLGDVDGDGDLDAFVTNSNQPNKIWINNGNGIFTDSGQSLGSSDSNKVFMGDLDGDSDMDAFVVNWNQPNTVWLNDGSGTFTDSGQSLGNLKSRGVDLGDIDGDGDLDAYVGNSTQPDTVWFNDGNGNFVDSGQSLGNSVSASISLSDLDGDGDLDAFVASNTPGQANKIWFNGGNGNFTDSGQSLGSSDSTGIYVADLDGDGDLDAFVANYGEANKVWLNDGNGIFTDSGQSLGSSISFDVSMGDLDGDGDLDVFVVNNQPNTVWINN